VRKRNLLPLAIVLLLTIPLALVLHDFARDVLLIELTRMVWEARMLFESLPQLPIWGLLLVSLVVMAVKSLGSHSKSQQTSAPQGAEHRGQVHLLARWIERTSQGEYFKWSLSQRLGGLTWEVMAYREHTTPEELKRRAHTGGLDLPPPIQTYLQSAAPSSFATPAGFLSRIRQRFGLHASSSSFDPALEQVVDFLEQQLEFGPKPGSGLPPETEHPLEEHHGRRNRQGIHSDQPGH
jgi:hypothetical protein